ncbi:MAG: PP2C family protein-serine/threonine phosphatase [Planctomycetes bacterium]|nr:PP2C family protein-serine/threonine phosphatase [Planctomycetota bacterium]
MLFRAILITAGVAQMIAAILALRLQWRYKWHSTWLLISGAAVVMTAQIAATLNTIWDVDPSLIKDTNLWATCLTSLVASILFLGGVALIRPLFEEIAKAEEILKREKQLLETRVQETEEELLLARRIQQDLLPSESPNLAGFEIAGISRPAEWTSGDYFDYIMLEDGSVIIVVADVSGHGTGPALLMSSTRAFLRGITHSCVDVGTILTLANRAIADDVRHGRFVTAFLANIDPHSRSMTYAAAGHVGFLIDTDGTVTELHSNAPPLGALRDTQIDRVGPIQLREGQILLLLTDGIPETQSSEGEQFGMDRAIQLVYEKRGLPVDKILLALYRATARFSDEAPQNDDITAVLVRVGSDPNV